MFAQAEHQRPIPGAVATVGVSERVTFLRKTYAHLVGAVFLMVALDYMLLDVGGPLFNAVSLPLLEMLGRYGGNAWLGISVVFMLVTWIADKWARSDVSRGQQYLGLGLSVVAYSVYFVPVLLQAKLHHPGVITDAGILTLFIFGGLTATVFMTKKDFSFMRGALGIASLGLVGIIVASLLFGFQLGMIFSAFGILLFAGYVLYFTSQVLHHYRPTQYVGASLALFTAVAMLFVYVLRFLSQLRD